MHNSFHLWGPSIISLLIFIALVWKFRKRTKQSKHNILWLGSMVFFLSYFLLVGGAFCYDLFLEWKLAQFDLNGDEIFSGEERTKAQKAALRKVTNDTGRNFAFIVGFFYAGFLSICVMLIGVIIKWFKN